VSSGTSTGRFSVRRAQAADIEITTIGGDTSAETVSRQPDGV
jgi:hypothetical protein